MKVLVLGGAGAVASETTRDLYYNSMFEEIVVADIDLKKAKAISEELRNRGREKNIPEAYRCAANRADFDQKRISAAQVNAVDVSALAGLFKGFDVIACGLPFTYDLQVTEAAIMAGVNTLDLGFAEEQLDFDHAAKEKNVTYVTGVGATPGITNLMARQGIERLDRAESVRVYFAAFRCLAPSPGLLNTTLWEFDPAISERLYYEEGKMIPVEPFTGQTKVRFHDLIGEQEVVFIPHPETATLSAAYPALKHVEVKGTFPPPIMRLMKALLDAGLLSRQEAELCGGKTSFYQAISDLLLQAPESRRTDVWTYGLVVEVSGLLKGEKTTFVYSNSHPPQERWGKEKAYYKNVGIPLAIGAEMLAGSKSVPAGVLPPELVFNPDHFFERLARRGIIISEQKVTAV